MIDTGAPWQENKDRVRQNMLLYGKYTPPFTRGRTPCNLRVQFLLLISSLNMWMPPKKGKKKNRKDSRMNRPCSIASANLWNPACSLLAMQLHTTCWVLSRECGQQVAGELMKCQDGGREIACITYPQGALVVFPRISHTRVEYSDHTLKEKVVLPSTHNLLFLYICENERNYWAASSLPKTLPQFPKVTSMKRVNCMPHCQPFY